MILPFRALLEISIKPVGGFESVVLKTLSHSGLSIIRMEQSVLLDRLHAVLYVQGSQQALTDAVELLDAWFKTHELEHEISYKERNTIDGLFSEGEARQTSILRLLTKNAYPNLEPLAELYGAADVREIRFRRNISLSGQEKTNLTEIVLQHEAGETDALLTFLRTQRDMDFSLLPEIFFPSLVIFDMDSTLIENETIDEIAAEAGVKERVADITERAMKGELDFSGALRERVSLLEGLPASVLETVKHRLTLTTGARELAGRLRSRGVRLVLASGGFTFFTSHFANILEFDSHHSNVLAAKDGKLTGEVEGEITDAAQKQRVLLECSAKHGIHVSNTVAIGDGANDALMLSSAGAAVAFNAREKLLRVANAAIHSRDLLRLLPLIGIQ